MKRTDGTMETRRNHTGSRQRNRMWKRGLSLFICLVMFVSLLPVTAAKAEASYGYLYDSDVYVGFVNDVITPEGYTCNFDILLDNADGTYASGEEIDTDKLYAVLNGGNYAGGENVTLPETMLFTCTSSYVTFPADVRGMEITIPVRSIYKLFRDAGLEENRKIKTLTIPAGIELIDGLLPAYSTYDGVLETVTFAPGSGIKTIGFRAFRNCETLTSINISECTNLTSIGDEAFSGCTNLTEIYLPDSVQTLGYRAFSGCTGLTSVSLGRDLADLCEGQDINQDRMMSMTFDDCSQLETVDMSRCEKLTVIPAGIFAGARIRNLTIPDCVEIIREKAFYNQGYEEGEESYYGAGDNVVYTLTSLHLGSGVKTIGEEAFAWNRSLSGTLSLPDSLTEIGCDAFAGAGVSDIRWPDNPEFTTVRGFDGCVNLPGAVIANLPYSVDTIDARAFGGCSGITDLTIPAYIREIGESAFFGCENLTSLTILPGLTTIREEAFARCTGLIGGTIELPESVSAVYDRAFAEILVPSEDEAVNDPPLTVRMLNPDIAFIDDGDPFYSTPGVELYAHETDSAGGVSVPKAYADEENGRSFNVSWYIMNDQYPAGKNCYRTYTHTINFHDLTAEPVFYAVSGALPEGISVTVKQGGEALPATVTGGRFEARAMGGKDVAVIARREGFYDQVLVRSGSDFTGEWVVDLASLAFEPLPPSGRMSVNISLNGEPYTGLENLTLKLERGSAVLAEGRDYLVSYPFLILQNPDAIGAEESLTLTVTPDPSLQAASGTASATLRSGTFSVGLASFGRVTVNASGTTAAPCTIVLFDAEGNALAVGNTAGGTFLSDPLPAGTYTAAVFESNSFFGAVGSLSGFGALGLQEGRDYVKSTVRVSDGSVSELSLTVPRLDASRLTSALDAERCAVIIRSDRMVRGQVFDVRVQYALKDNSVNNAKINFTIPAGADLLSVSDDSRRLSASGSSVTVSKASGNLYLTVKCGRTGIQSFGASVTTGSLTLPLGSAAVNVQDIFLTAAEANTASRTGNKAEIYASPRTSVALSVSGGGTFTGTTNAAGYVTVSYDLPEKTVYGQLYTLTARAGEASDTDTIAYYPSDMALESLSFFHHNSETLVYSRDSGSGRSHYTYFATGQEADKYFFIDARLTHTGEIPQNLRAVVTMQDGSTREVPLAKWEEYMDEDCYYGELYVDNHLDHVFDPALIPVRFEVEWDETEPVFDTTGLNEYLAAAVSDREAERKEILENARAQAGYEPMDTAALKAEIMADLSVLVSEGNLTEAALEAAVDEGMALVSDEVSVFGGGCRHSAIPDPAIQEEEFLALQYEFESYMDQCLDQFTEVFGLDQPIQDYRDGEDMLRGMGFSVNSSPSASELSAQGFEAFGDAFVKELENGFSCAWPENVRRMRSMEKGTPDDGGFNDGSISLTEEALPGLHALVGAGGNSQQGSQVTAAVDVGTVGGWARTAAADTINGLTTAADTTLKKTAAQLADQKAALKNIKDEVQEAKAARKYAAQKKVYTGDKVFNGAVKQGGNLLTAWSVYDDGTAFCDNMVRQAEIDGYVESLELLKHYYEMHPERAPIGCYAAIEDELKVLKELQSLLAKKGIHLGINVLWGCGSMIVGVFTGGTASVAINTTYDAGSAAISARRDYVIAQVSQALRKMRQIRYEKCGGPGFRKGKSLTPLLDPSGIVYEAVESNPLTGVTASIFDVSNNRVWDAAGFDQVSPQITGDDGSYAWDVPSGRWKILFTKEGYRDASTAELEVPPPRMNLRTAMVSQAAPKVESIHAYPDYVEILFSQYMDTDIGKLTIPAGYRAEWADPTPVSATDTTVYARILHLIPTGAKPSEGAKVTVTLGGAKNYAGTPLGAYSSPSLTVTRRPASLTLNYTDQIALFLGEDPAPRVTVRVLDQDGAPVSGLHVTGSLPDNPFASLTEVSAVTDEKGIAAFSVEGTMPGMTTASFTVDGTTLTESLPLRVMMESNQVSRPSAKVGSTAISAGAPKENNVTIEAGEQLILTCDTEGAEIYYTTNDSCPCQNTADRVLYTGPVTITEDTYFRIAAYKAGMEYSERLNIHVTVNKAPRKFTDVPEGAYYADAVDWAVERGITQGTSETTFSPGAGCTRGQVVTFLWRAAGEPEPASTVCPFTDVKPSAYYYKAVLWAVGKDITKGTSATAFSPGTTCTRGQIVTFLHRYRGTPAPKGAASPFKDVKAGAYYEKAVLWAVENDITKGTAADAFSPNATCTRGQVVTFLYRAEKAYSPGIIITHCGSSHSPAEAAAGD